ncbi:hypothetical protein CEF21_16375 [Bacillus sp. FJAT-42376]|nr:hypothetical protein CEF21_16375 [Bacillus sp. FJAT-42376]
MKNWGAPVQLSETRTAAVCRDAFGRERIVIAAKGFFLIINPETEETIQLSMNSSEYPYVSYATSGGLYCSGAGSVFYCIDPFAGKCVFKENAADEAAVFTLTEGPGGLVYFVSYPNLCVSEFDPVRLRLRRLPSLKSESRYAGTMAAGGDGWIYIGLGTENPSIAAFHPATGEHSIIARDSAVPGTGYVRKGNGGRVYGQYKTRALRMSDRDQDWAELAGGKAVREIPPPEDDPEYWGEGFHTCHGQLTGADQLEASDLAEKKLKLTGKSISLFYKTRGAELSAVAAAPDGKLYGTSMHPMKLFTADKRGTKLLGSLEEGGGGNICTYASLDDSTMIGFAYAGGKMYEFSLKKPFAPNRNPKLIGKTEAIHRPRDCAVHPNERCIVFSGFPGYGERGGSLGIYFPEKGKIDLLPPGQVIPDQSTVSLAFDSKGDMIGATSILTPGGARQMAEEAVLYKLNWKNKKIENVSVPFPLEKEISHICVSGNTGYGMTQSSLFFRFDSRTLAADKLENCSAFGKPVRGGCIQTADFAFFLLESAIWKVDFHSHYVSCLPVKENITSGGAIIGSELYFCSGTSLLSMQISGGDAKWREVLRL